VSNKLFLHQEEQVAREREGEGDHRDQSDLLSERPIKIVSIEWRATTCQASETQTQYYSILPYCCWGTRNVDQHGQILTLVSPVRIPFSVAGNFCFKESSQS
jgi:hypothetical protein